MYTIIVTGSRHYMETERVTDVLGTMYDVHENNLFVKVGDNAGGVDLATRIWSRQYLLSTQRQTFEARWALHGKAAGPIRNHVMVDSGADLVIAWPLDDSKGTKECAEYAAEQGIRVWFPDLPSWAQWAAPIAHYQD